MGCVCVCICVYSMTQFSLIRSHLLSKENKLKGCKSESTNISKGLFRDPGRDNGRLNLGDDKKIGKGWATLRDIW